MKHSLRIWHRVKHDDFAVTEIDFEKSSDGAQEAIVTAEVVKTMQYIKNNGGFWTRENTFVPWHSISHIEYKRE